MMLLASVHGLWKGRTRRGRRAIVRRWMVACKVSEYVTPCVRMYSIDGSYDNG